MEYFSDIPKVEMTEQEFKERVSRSYRTTYGIQLTKMNKKDFQNWIGLENIHNGKLKVYRGVPDTVENFRNGDFCTTNEIYALTYGRKVISKDVELKYLKYITGHKNGNPNSVGIADKGTQPVEFVYVTEKDNFSSFFKSFEYKKYLQYISSQ